jgi:redox-regulated HSP33 family molecular chaperone
MVKALQRWLDTHQLPAIIAAVLGVVLTISVLMLAVGYMVARQ